MKSHTDQIKKLFSRKKPASALQPAVVLPEAPEKKTGKLNASFKAKKSKVVTSVPQVATPIPELTNVKILESYPLIEPFAYAHIVKDVR